MARTTTDQPPVVHVVAESFVIDVDGVPTSYRKGEPIEADDPLIKRNPQHFEPLVYPHPIKRRGHIATPEVRS